MLIRFNCNPPPPAPPNLEPPNPTPTPCRWITDAACVALGRLKHLTTLNLSGTHCSGRALTWLRGCTLLQRLDMSACKLLRNDGLQAACNLAALTRLEFAHSLVTNKGIASLARLSNLRHVNLGSNFEVNDRGWAALAACSGLQNLDVGGFNIARRLPPPAFAALLHLSFGGQFANQGLHLLFPLPALRVLVLQVRGGGLPLFTCSAHALTDFRVADSCPVLFTLVIWLADRLQES